MYEFFNPNTPLEVLANVGAAGFAVAAGLTIYFYFRLNVGNKGKPIMRMTPPGIIALILVWLGAFIDGLFSPLNPLHWQVFAVTAVIGGIIALIGCINPFKHGGATWGRVIIMVMAYLVAVLSSSAVAGLAYARWGYEANNAEAMGFADKSVGIVSLLNLVLTISAIGLPIILAVGAVRAVRKSRKATKPTSAPPAQQATTPSAPRTQPTSRGGRRPGTGRGTQPPTGSRRSSNGNSGGHAPGSGRGRRP